MEKARKHLLLQPNPTLILGTQKLTCYTDLRTSNFLAKSSKLKWVPNPIPFRLTQLKFVCILFTFAVDFVLVVVCLEFRAWNLQLQSFPSVSWQPNKCIFLHSFRMELRFFIQFFLLPPFQLYPQKCWARINFLKISN